MVNYEEVRVKLRNNKLKKLENAAKNKTRTTLRITKKNFQDEELPQKLFLSKRQKNKIKDPFANNMSMDIKKLVKLNCLKSGLVHAKRFSHAQNYVHINQSNHFKVKLKCYLR